LWHWNREQDAHGAHSSAKEILDGVLKARMGWQPTMQVLYGLQDLFDPACLSDPRMAKVVPASAIEWYRSAQGQCFTINWRLRYCQNKSLDAHDLQAQWNSAPRRAGAADCPRQERGPHMAAHGARILFGTDTPMHPRTRISRTERMARNATHVEAGMTPLQVLSRRHAGYSNLNGALMLGTALIRKS